MNNTNRPSKTTRRCIFGGMAGLAAMVLGKSRKAHAAVRTVRFGHNNIPDSMFGRGAIAFAEAVAADPVIGSVLKVEIYDNSRLGDDMGMLKDCIKGTLDGMLIAGSLISNVVPEVGVMNAPYLFRDVAQARAVLDGPIGQEFIEIAKRKGVPVLCWGENGMRQISSNTPVRNLADLHGLKIRVPQSQVILGGLRALGADAAPLAFVLLREALRTGEFQAQENAISIIETGKFYEVQKYLCLTSHIYDAVGFVASPDLLEDLDEPQRAALVRCAQKGAVVTRQISDETAKDGVGRLKAKGMIVIDDVDIAGLRTASRPYLESLGTTFGGNMVKNLLAAGA